MTLYRSRWQFYWSLHFLADNVLPKRTESNLTKRNANTRIGEEENKLQYAYSVNNKPSAKSAKKTAALKTGKLLETALTALKKQEVKPPDNSKRTVGIFGDMGLSHSTVGLKQMSEVIEECLGIKCSVLMGANLANEVANEKFTETTIGCNDTTQWDVWKNLFHCSYFKVNVVEDAHTVELCGALKNIVAVGAGLVDGLGYGENTKAAIIRLGMIEMKLFANTFYDNVKESTFLESCGIADLIATCYGGRNRKVAEAYVRTGKTLEVLEEELLNGQKLQGPHTAHQVNILLKSRNMEHQ
eukprot:gene3849-4385_t